MELLRRKCPGCHSADMQYHSPYTPKNHGGRVIYKCAHWPVYFSETKNTRMEGLKTPVSVIWHVLQARTEGMGLTAVARTFEQAKKTLLAWERTFLALHQVLCLSALGHEFLELGIEGDEAYPKGQKNVPPDQSRGWTLLLMERASRFMGALDWGKKDRKRFQKARKTWDTLARQTQDLRIFTDGERRYGPLLFAICYALGKHGQPGRPKKTCKRGGHIRSKHKGSQAQKKGPKRPKYQSPWAEHPETNRTIEASDIHANHAEAFFSSLRRKCATLRSKTNMYAKSTKGLQRRLRVYWVVHHVLRVHFTTRDVPAVALGILERRLSGQEIFQIHMA